MRSFYWDNAGPLHFDQIHGLLEYGISASQLTFGTVCGGACVCDVGLFQADDDAQDFPYATNYTYASSITAIVNATFASLSDKQRIFPSNAEELFGGLR